MINLDKGDYGDCFSSFFEYQRYLGDGSYGKVVKARDRYSSKICAVKVLFKSKLSESFLSSLRNEASLLSSLDHPNIVKFFSVKESNTRIFISMEYLRGGTLSELIQKKRLSDKTASKIMKSLLKGVDYLHRKGIIHRDLKPDNILIARKSDLSSVKIADFGMCTQIELGGFLNEKAGTILYMSPEQAANKNYGKAVDIWSLGIILYKIIEKGKHPLFTPGEDIELFWKRLEKPSWIFFAFSEMAKSLFLALVRVDPFERYSTAQALAHPWITEENKEIPKTHIESMRIFDAEIKLKTVFFSVFFVSLARISFEDDFDVELPRNQEKSKKFKTFICRSPCKLTTLRTRTIIK
jgi:calcium/calmodulin-dependent protein kinase I